MIKELFLAVLMATTASVALADGPRSAYDGDEDLALAPNERVVSEGLVNDDGAMEDPNHQMTPTARAFRNGLINGREMQKTQDQREVAQVNVPPLPPMPKGYAGYPAAAQVTVIPLVKPQPQQQYDPREYVQTPQQYRQRPQAPVVVNVMPPDPRYYEPAEQYGRAPSWRNRMEQQQQYGDYDDQPYANERPVYVQQQPMYAPPPAPVYYAPPPQPVYYVQRAQPAYYPPVGYAGVSARWGRVRIGVGGYGY
jgi:hypothetical protein